MPNTSSGPSGVWWTIWCLHFLCVYNKNNEQWTLNSGNSGGNSGGGRWKMKYHWVVSSHESHVMPKKTWQQKTFKEKKEKIKGPLPQEQGASCQEQRFFGALCTVLGSILVRCAPFWARFWCVVHRFGLDFGAPCAVLGSVLVRCVPFWARYWCAVRRFGLDFGALCTVLGSILVRCAPFWARFWCAVRRFGLDFGAPCAVLGSILVRCASFWARFCGAQWTVFGSLCAVLGSILVRCAPFWARC